MFDLAGRRLFLAGHSGLVGSAILRRLSCEDCEVIVADRTELDLTRQSDVENWFARMRPDTVVLAAARVGGIVANEKYPAGFLYENLMIESNVIHAAASNGVSKLLFLGSSCIYPKHASQPITEDALLTGPLEPTNQWYAIAKIAGLMLAQAYRREHGLDFISAMPTNLYGPGDNFDPETSHVFPALVRRFFEARQSRKPVVSLLGTGAPLREFLHSDDCADALVFVLKNYSDEAPINIGSGQELSIRDLAERIALAAGYGGEIRFDGNSPDGTMRKRLDCNRLEALGWRASIELDAGIREMLTHFRQIQA